MFYVMLICLRLVIFSDKGQYVYSPINPTFSYIKWGFPGCSLQGLVNALFSFKGRPMKWANKSERIFLDSSKIGLFLVQKVEGINNLPVGLVNKGLKREVNLILGGLNTGVQCKQLPGIF